MRRCIIHIGHPKTASTYLQHCLHLNTALFAAANYWVPSDFSHLDNYNLTALSEEGHVISGNLGPLYELMTAGPGDARPAMHEFLFGAPGMPADCDVLLSTEVFFYYRNALAEIIRIARGYGLAVELWGYAQRQDRAAIASYLQNVRMHGFSGGVVDFLTHDANMPYCRYDLAMRRVKTLAPDVPIRLRSFEQEFLAGDDILTDFLTAIGSRVPAAACRRPPRASNTGVTLEHYELLRVAAILGWNEAGRHLEADEVALTAADRARTHAFYYRPGVRRFLAEHYLPENAALLADFIPHASDAERAYWQTLDEPAERPEPDRALMAELGDMAFARQAS